MIWLFRWSFHLIFRWLIIHILFFVPLLGDFVAGAFVLFKWANVKVTEIKKI